ncbi:MAG: GrpB family protein [Thermomicrobiales bacterium]|nr:GrpB family protein [Thermomicrobiales bacterium]
MDQPPIGPYPNPKPPAALRPWNPQAPEAAARLIALIDGRLPGTLVEHIGSSAVPGCAGKGYLDLLIPYRDDEHLAVINAALFALGFGRQRGPEPFPESRPMRHGTFTIAGETFLVHVHVVPATSPEVAELRDFRDRLRADLTLLNAYVEAKRAILEASVTKGTDYAKTKGRFIASLGYRGAAEEPHGASP